MPLDLITELNWFDRAKDTLNGYYELSLGYLPYITDITSTLPNYVAYISFILLIFAIIGVLLSHAIGIYRNMLKHWKPKSDSKLVFGFFYGSGQLQREKIYEEAHELLFDKKWFWISIAGLAYRLGNMSHASVILMFFCSLVYLPLVILGYVEIPPKSFWTWG